MRDATPRRRVLISAYACGPLAEPEAAAGWAFARAAAVNDDVHVITRARFRPVIEAELAQDAHLAAHLTVEYLELGDRALALKRGTVGIYWYYVLWQRALGVRARALHGAAPFDLAHHVTFANDWMPCGLAGVPGLPFVWGPVGGASPSPLPLVRWLGVRGTVTEVLRVVVTAPWRRLWGDQAARRAAVVLAQNPDVAHRFRFARDVVVEPNASLDARSLPEPTVRDRPADERRAVFVGRLIAWKGARIAVAALADERLARWTLDVYGTGYELGALRRLVTAHDLQDRVRFLGHRPRSEVLAAIGAADAMIFPSMHDQAGWVAAEASALGCPVVCLPLGGPQVLADINAHVASLDGDLARNVADVVATLPDEPAPRSRRWDADRLPALLERTYARALGSGSEA